MDNINKNLHGELFIMLNQFKKLYKILKKQKIISQLKQNLRLQMKFIRLKINGEVGKFMIFLNILQIVIKSTIHFKYSNKASSLIKK